MCGDNGEVLDPIVLPHLNQFVHDPVQGLPPEPGSPGVGTSADGDAVGKGRGPENARARRHRSGYVPGDDDVASHREMWTVLLQSPNGKNQSRIPVDGSTNFGPRQLIDRR